MEVSRTLTLRISSSTLDLHERKNVLRAEYEKLEKYFDSSNERTLKLFTRNFFLPPKLLICTAELSFIPTQPDF